MPTKIDVNNIGRGTAFVLTILVVSVLLNVGLGLHWRSTRAASPSGGSLPGNIYRGPQIDDLVGPLHLQTLDGSPATIDPADLQLVVYVVSPTCGFCQRNTENIRALANASRGRYRFVGISTDSDGLDSYLKRWDPTFPIYVRPQPATLKALGGFGITPLTVVILRTGRVGAVWTGAFVGTTKTQVEAFFNVDLPGLPRMAIAGDQCEDEYGQMVGRGFVVWANGALNRCDGQNQWRAIHLPIPSNAQFTAGGPDVGTTPNPVR